MTKHEELEKIVKEVKNCRKCPLWETATNPVPGEGNPNTEVMFIGESPGYWEDQKGRPFVGQAGKLLDHLLSSIGIKRGEVFIANVLKHRPPGNRDPLPEEVEACKNWLDKQIEIIQPKVIVTLGRFAMYEFIPNGKITKIHGQPRIVNWQNRKITILPMFHPAAALRNVRIMEEIKEDFKKIPKVLEKKIQIDQEPKEVDSGIKKKTTEGKKESEQLVLTI